MPDGRPFEEYEYDEYGGDVDGEVGVDVGVDQHLLLPLLCHHHQVLSIWLHLPRANWQFVIDNFLIGETLFIFTFAAITQLAVFPERVESSNLK